MMMIIIIIIIIIIECKAKVIPTIIGKTGTISKAFRKYVNNIPGHREVKKLQKNSHIGHCPHTSESANVEIQWSQRRN